MVGIMLLGVDDGILAKALVRPHYLGIHITGDATRILKGTERVEPGIKLLIKLR